MTPLVLKLGGELLEGADQRARVASFASRTHTVRPLVLVHGGGTAIDRELNRRGLTPSKVDGLRVTDAATLDAVVAVLAGSANTELVAALVSAGVPAVGLTGVDAAFASAAPAEAHVTASGRVVDLGFVGDPDDIDPSVVALLLRAGYVPVIASLGLAVPRSATGPRSVLNVNADVMACRLAEALGASELVIAGTTAGVLDADGRTMAALDADGIDALVAAGTATAGMIAKLSACRRALDAGVTSIRLVDGRGIDAGAALSALPGTVVTAAAAVEP